MIFTDIQFLNDEIFAFINNHLIDSIKIHICFENFLKAIFLSKEYIVHKLDKNIFPEYHKRQENEPILFSEIKEQSEWEINPKIKPNIEGISNMQIKGILNLTLGTNVLTKPKYLEKINFNQEILEIIKPYLNYRNNLHFYTGESFNLSKDNYDNLIKIINFVNKNMVSMQNKIVDYFNKDDHYKLKIIE